MRNLLMAAFLIGCGALGRDLTPLVVAARAGDAAKVRSLVDSGANIEERAGVNGWTPLMHAIHNDHPDVALLLLELGADANARANRGTTPLMLAAPEGQVEVVKALLRRGADPRASTVDGVTALSNAVAAGQGAVIDALLSQDPELKLADNFAGIASRWLARLQGRADVLTRLAR
ncbi:MAG TPA: ankyrin repeat domain-containing protein [Myxococcales bacterium]